MKLKPGSNLETTVDNIVIKLVASSRHPTTEFEGFTTKPCAVDHQWLQTHDLADRERRMLRTK